jgi:hypothetical protein
LPRAALLANALAVAVLIATAAAFVFAESLKLEKSPLTGTRVDEVFSPVCACETDRARMSFRLRREDTVTVEIVGPTGVVRTLAHARPVSAGRVNLAWDGRDDRGRVVPDGIYRPRVELEDFGRTYDLTNKIHLDTKAPSITVVRAAPWAISPDRDGRSERLTVRYRLSEPASAALYVDGDRRVLNRGVRLAHKLVWNGRVFGRPDFGRHRLAVVARDLAGNVARLPLARRLRVRFVALRRHLFDARAGGRVRVPVDTDAKQVDWRLGRRSGTGDPHPLVLRAPDRPGLYRLSVRVGPQTAHARVRVVGQGT